MNMALTRVFNMGFKARDYIKEMFYGEKDLLNYRSWRRNWDNAEEKMALMCMADFEKLRELKSCLGGPAKAMISPLEDLDGNYKVALDMLNETFGSTSNDVRHILEDFMKQPKLSSSGFGDLVTFRGRIMSLTSHLTLLQQPHEHLLELILMAFLESKLNPDLLRKWHKKAAEAASDIARAKNLPKNSYVPVPMSVFKDFLNSATMTAMREAQTGQGGKAQKQQSVAL